MAKSLTNLILLARQSADMGVTARFWSKVCVAEDSDVCWPWLAYRDKDGYGIFRPVAGQTMKRAPRVAWEMANGRMPKGLEIDHLCKNPACVNPAHLEAVTHEENMRRRAKRREPGTFCIRGHEYTPDNVKVRASGRRSCRACENG
jgi:hypothetical protein